MLSPKLAVRDRGTIQGKGLFAVEHIEPGEKLWEVDATATIISLEQYLSEPPATEPFYSQIGIDAYVLSEDDAYFWNHSCEPNCWSVGPRIFAMQDVPTGQEVTYDYGLVEISVAWQMTCRCGSRECRKVVGNTDFLLPAVQRRHAGHIPQWVQEVIDRTGAEGSN